MVLADIENRLGNTESAISILQKLSKKPDFQIRASLKLTELYYQSGLYQEGISELNSVLKNDRLDEDALQLAIKGHISLNQKEEAINKLRLLNGLWQQNPGKLLRLSRLQQQIQEVIPY